MSIWERKISRRSMIVATTAAVAVVVADRAAMQEEVKRFWALGDMPGSLRDPDFVLAGDYQHDIKDHNKPLAITIDPRFPEADIVIRTLWDDKYGDKYFYDSRKFSRFMEKGEEFRRGSSRFQVVGHAAHGPFVIAERVDASGRPLLNQWGAELGEGETESREWLM